VPLKPWQHGALQILYCTVTELEKLLNRCLPGGYEEQPVENSSGEEDVSTTFAGTELRGTLHRPKRRRHLFVSTRDHDVNVIKAEIIQSLTNFLQTRLGVEKASGTLEACYADMLKALSPMCLNAGGVSDEDIHKAYAIMASDQNCQDFFASYGELLTCLKTAGANKSLYDIFAKTSLQVMVNYSLV